MVEKAQRERIETDNRANPTRQWEVFCREETDDPLRHVGSVAAGSGTDAHEHASRLFGWYAVDVWVCPADEVDRYSTRGLASETDERTSGNENETSDRNGDRDATDESTEPRVYEETEGKPEVNDT